MTNSFLPQAYTREDLTRAYAWLQAQPESVKDRADNSDALVALYLRAKRIGHIDINDDNPKSRLDFQKDLAELAPKINEFERSQGSVAPTAPIQAPAQAEVQPKVHTPKNELRDLLDSRSWNAIQDVKVRLNLSSDMEVMRLLIALGFEKARTILPHTED